MKKIVLYLIILSMLLYSGCILKDKKTDTHVDKVVLCTNLPTPKIYDNTYITSLDEITNKSTGRIDFRNKDLSMLSIDYSDIVNSVFDNNTIWPSCLADNIDMQNIRKYGENPGLKIRQVHENGYTGKDINIAIIDTRLLINHIEFSDNIVYYEEMYNMNGTAHYHGTQITSALVGKNVGIAPEANVYYFAYQDGNRDHNEAYIYLRKAIEKIIDINKTLPVNDKIKIIYISTEWDETNPYGKKVSNAIDKAMQENIFVITPKLYTDNFQFAGIHRNLLNDPDIESSYKSNLTLSTEPLATSNILLVPTDARYLASPSGIKDYVMYTNGSPSISLSYISGLYVLAYQANQSITPDLFWQKALETGTPINNDEHCNQILINPLKLIKNI